MRKANGNLTRRDLLKRSAVAALAAPWFVPAAALGRDKKARGGRTRLVLLEAPGKPVTGVERPNDEVRAALNELIAD